MPAGINPRGIHFNSWSSNLDLVNHSSQNRFCFSCWGRRRLLPDAYFQILRIMLAEHIIFIKFRVSKYVPPPHRHNLCQEGLNHFDKIEESGRWRNYYSGFLIFSFSQSLKKRRCKNLRFPARLMFRFAPNSILSSPTSQSPVRCPIGDVHYPLYGITRIGKKLFQHILHYIGPQIAYMGEMINSGPQVYILTVLSLGENSSIFLVKGVIQLHILFFLYLVGSMYFQ